MKTKQDDEQEIINISTFLQFSSILLNAKHVLSKLDGSSLKGGFRNSKTNKQNTKKLEYFFKESD